MTKSIYSLILAIIFSTQLTINAFSKATLIAEIPVSISFKKLAVNEKANKVYVVNKDTITLSVIDGSMDSITSNITVFNSTDFGSVSDLAVNSNTGNLYISKSPSFSSINQNEVSIIDSLTNGVIAEIDLAPSSITGNIAIDSTGNRIYLDTSMGAGTLTAISGNTNTILDTISIDTPSRQILVNTATNKIYAASGNKNEIYVLEFNPSTNMFSFIQKITVGEINPDSIALNPNTKTLYTHFINDDKVHVINTETNTETQPIPIAPLVGAMSGAGEVTDIAVYPKTGRLYAAYRTIGSSRTNNAIAVINTTDNKNTLDETIMLDFDFVNLLFNQTTNKIYAASQLDSETKIYVLDAGTPPSDEDSAALGGAVLVSNFTAELDNIKKALGDLHTNIESKSKSKKQLGNFYIGKITKLSKKLSSAIKSPKPNNCKKGLANLLIRFTSLISSFDNALCSHVAKEPCLDSDADSIFDSINSSFNAIKDISDTDNGGNGVPDVCEQ